MYENNNINELDKLVTKLKDGDYVSTSKITKLLKKLDSEINSLKAQTNTINIEGNNGGNFIKITRKDDKRIELEIGDCTLITYDCIVPNEWLSRILTEIIFLTDDDKRKYKSNPKELLYRFGWGNSNDAKFNEQLIAMIEDKYASEPTDEHIRLQKEFNNSEKISKLNYSEKGESNIW